MEENFNYLNAKTNKFIIESLDGTENSKDGSMNKKIQWPRVIFISSQIFPMRFNVAEIIM